MNIIMLRGRKVNCERTPLAITSCGFKNPGEVAAAVKKYGRIVTPMEVSDVADWFDEHYGSVREE